MMRESKKFYFSVEGNTEEWYLEWLQDCINDSNDALYKVKFEKKVEKDPVSFVKVYECFR